MLHLKKIELYKNKPCVKGKLVLIRVETDDLEKDFENSLIHKNEGLGNLGCYNPIIVSTKEEVIYGDIIYDGHEIAIRHHWDKPNKPQPENVCLVKFHNGEMLERKASDCKLVIVFPNQFSLEQLKMIDNNELYHGCDVVVECEGGCIKYVGNSPVIEKEEAKEFTREDVINILEKFKKEQHLYYLKTSIWFDKNY